MAPSTSDDPVAVHGWIAVPTDANVVLGGNDYIHEPEPLLVRDIKFPSDDPLVARVQEYAHEKLAPQTFNHSMRVYYFGTSLVAFDPMLVAVDSKGVWFKTVPTEHTNIHGVPRAINDDSVFSCSVSQHKPAASASAPCK